MNEKELKQTFIQVYNNWNFVASQLINVDTLKEPNSLYKYSVTYRYRQLDLIFLLFYKIKFLGRKLTIFPFEYEQVINVSIHLFNKYNLDYYVWVYYNGLEMIQPKKFNKTLTRIIKSE